MELASKSEGIQIHLVASACIRLILETTVNEMQPSIEFKKFGLQFIQDLHLQGETVEDLLTNVLIPFDEEERSRLRVFLDEVLNAHLSDEELHRLWAATPSDVFFYKAEGMKTLFRMARDRL